ncbi:ATP phosphoribosyltransferase [Streptomyces microflavus]
MSASTGVTSVPALRLRPPAARLHAAHPHQEEGRGGAVYHRRPRRRRQACLLRAPSRSVLGSPGRLRLDAILELEPAALDAWSAAVALTPGLESPTISPLHHEGWVAVRSMVAAKEAQRIMDDLYELGARAILTTAIHACRL